MKHAIAILALGVMAGCAPSDPAETMAISVYTDPQTGCQYLHRLSGGITPRLNPDGTQVCTQKDETK